MNANVTTPRGAPTLAGALRLAARDLAAQQPPADLFARVQATLRAQGQAVLADGAAPLAAATPPAADGALVATRAGRGGRGVWAWSGAAATAVVLATSALLMLNPLAPRVAEDGPRLARYSDFVPLVPPERWPAETAPAWLVSTEMPAARLAALGLPFDPEHAGEAVRAELLMHPSGEVLAVRFLR